MSNRTTVFVSTAAAVAVSIFGITSISAQTVTSSDSKDAATKEDQCLAAPKATTPAGGHWYYRLEKGTKRKCWYLGDAGGKVNKAAAPKTTPVAEATIEESDTVPPPAKKPMQKSFANARAELRPGAPEEDPSLAETTWPPLSPTTEATPQQDNFRQDIVGQDTLHQDTLRQDKLRPDNQAVAIQPAPQPPGTQSSNTLGWNIASRWPETRTVASADAPPVKNSFEPAPPAPALTPDSLTATATPAPAVTPAANVQTSAAAETRDSDTFSMRIVLALLVCVLALAAIIGPMIFKYVRPRPRKQHRVSKSRRPIWDMDITRESVRQDSPRMASPALYADHLPEPRVLDEAVDELEDLLARAARRPAA